MKNTLSGWTLNPVLMLAWLYFLANISSFFILLSDGEIGVDSLMMGFEPPVVHSVGISLFLSLLLLLILYKICDKFNYQKSELFFSDRWGWFLVGLQCIYFANNIYYGVNIAGVEDSSDSGPFKLFFNILQPDLIYLIVSLGLTSRKLFLINLIIFTCSMLFRGWIGGFFTVAIVFLCRNHLLKINSKLIFWIFGFLLTSFAIFPFIVELKWIIRSDASLSDVLYNIFDQGYFVSLGNSIEYLLNRFQMFGHVALIAENSKEVANAYDANQFIPYWADGAFQWIFLKVNNIEIFQLNRYMVNTFFGSENLAYSTNPGLAGWFFILQDRILIFIGFIVLVTAVPAYWVLTHAGKRYFLLLFSFVFIYLFHGWIGSYFNFVIYMIFILCLGKIFSRKRL